MKPLPLLALVLGASTSMWVGCSSKTCVDDGSCGVPSNDAGGDGGFVLPADCKLEVDAKDAPGCVVDSVGVFVDGAAGADGNPGTKAAPKKTLGAAIAAAGGKPRVYVCTGTYPERVRVTGALSVVGGWACGTWSYAGDKPKIAPTEKGVALTIEGASNVAFSDLDVTAQDGAAAGESSVAVFVTSSQVTLRRVSVTAGKGVDAVDASAVAEYTGPAPDGATGASGGAETPNPQCPTSIGGAGGKDGAASGKEGKVAQASPYPATSTGAGGTTGGTCATGLGTNGAYGTAGGVGAGAATSGTLDATGWKSAAAQPGGNGGDGQGGGGGAQINATGVGGAGGPGGCGGKGGAPGASGGSSIAIASNDSSVSLEAVTLTARDAGKGAKGANGQKGQLAGSTQPAPNGPKACAGGFGGVGGGGGGGGGGAGGVSVGVLYKGAAPRIAGSPVTGADSQPGFTVGAKGARGTKGLGGISADLGDPPSRAGTDGTDGADGASKAVMALP